VARPSGVAAEPVRWDHVEGCRANIRTVGAWSVCEIGAPPGMIDPKVEG
jgi:hypothetical protein